MSDSLLTHDLHQTPISRSTCGLKNDELPLCFCKASRGNLQKSYDLLDLQDSQMSTGDAGNSNTVDSPCNTQPTWTRRTTILLRRLWICKVCPRQQCLEDAPVCLTLKCPFRLAHLCHIHAYTSWQITHANKGLSKGHSKSENICTPVQLKLLW